jgi:phage/plasmid-like protein (TIGR03299 family)
MSHLIETMAYTGQTPWHQLGHALPKKQSIDVWAQAAGMQWKIQETPVRYMATGDADALYGEALEFPEQKVLYRSDTNAALSVVSQRYKVVQPQEVLEFYRDLSEVAGFELETAGVLKAGRRFWALARTGKSACLKGNDVVHSYLLLATSCDGTLATMAIPTSVRVVCNNTWRLHCRVPMRVWCWPSRSRTPPASMPRPSNANSVLLSANGTASCTA